MGMKVEWDCKNGHTNDPEDPDYSWLRCSECLAWRWDWLKWAVAGVVGLVIIISGYFLTRSLFQKPEAIYQNNYKKYVLAEETGKAKFEISPQGQKVLDDLAERQRFSEDQVKKLVQEGRKEVLVKLIEDYNQAIKPEKAREIKDLANKWGINQEKGLEWGFDLAKLVLVPTRPSPPPPGPTSPVVKPKEEPPVRPIIAKIDLDKVKTLLHEGKFAEARKDLAQGEPGVDPEMDKLRQDMETPTELAVNFQYQRPRSKPSEKLAVTSPGLADLYLTPKDNYRMFIETHSPCYLYIFQIDAEGRVERLFPNPFYNKTDNPVLPLLSLQIPFTHSEWLYLEEVGREAPPKKNILYFLATPWPATHLDELYGKLYRETNRETRNEILKEFMAALEGWKTAHMPALYFQEFSFFQVAKVPPGASPRKK
jgi:hypothetical protein